MPEVWNVLEEWLVIEEAPRYLVSNYGRIWSRINDIVLKPSLTTSGYLAVRLSTDNGFHTSTIHELVAKTFYPGDHRGLQVNHIDGDKLNNYAWNLEWVTPGENIRHAFRTGLNKSGRRKAVRIIETEEEFESELACAKHIGGNQGNISNCLAGRCRSYMGLHFEYIIPD